MNDKPKSMFCTNSSEQLISEPNSLDPKNPKYNCSKCGACVECNPDGTLKLTQGGKQKTIQPANTTTSENIDLVIISCQIPN